MKSRLYKVTFGTGRSRRMFVTIAPSEHEAINKIIAAYGRCQEPLDTEHVEAATDPNDVWSLVRIAMQKGLSPKIEFVNNARSATKSYVTSLCLSRFLNSTADLVFVEFIANDGSEMDTQLLGPLDKTRSYERFLRRIQAQPSNPAVVMMQARGARLCASATLPAPGLGGRACLRTCTHAHETTHPPNQATTHPHRCS